MTHTADNTDAVTARQALRDAIGNLIGQPRIELQYGVIRDLRERGLGLRLEYTSTDIKAAEIRAAQLERQGMTAFIQQRHVITGSWTPLLGSSDGGTTTSGEEQA